MRLRGGRRGVVRLRGRTAPRSPGDVRTVGAEGGESRDGDGYAAAAGEQVLGMWRRRRSTGVGARRTAEEEVAGECARRRRQGRAGRRYRRGRGRGEEQGARAGSGRVWTVEIKASRSDG